MTDKDTFARELARIVIRAELEANKTRDRMHGGNAA